MKKQYIFIDDSGDPGLTGATGNYFLMAAVVFNDRETASKVNEEIYRFRKNLGWQEKSEFKFVKTNKKIIKRLLIKVSDHDFAIYAIILNKAKYKDVLELADKKKVYNWMAKELLKNIPLKNAYVKIDGGSSKQDRAEFATYIRQNLNSKEYLVKSFKSTDSTKDNLIQLADLIAGSIGRSFKNEKTDKGIYFNIIKNKIYKIIHVKL